MSAATNRAFHRPAPAPVMAHATGDMATDQRIFHSAPLKLATKSNFRGKAQSESAPHVLDWTETTPVNQQQKSVLFRLPREIREIIWKHTLAQTETSRPAHFHVYDLVYDSCAYHAYTEADAHRRLHPRQMSLLLTCRAVYLEALRFLYENSDFVLILLAGRARPREILDNLNCLGSIKDCERMFMRMRNINLVIQPGEHPHAEKYAGRITELLDVFHNFDRVTKFSLDFNLNRRFAWRADRDASFQTIIKALYPLRHKSGTPIVIQPSAFLPRPPTEDDFTFDELHAELQGSTMLPWSYSAWKENHSPCSQRGFDHHRISFFNPLYPWKRRFADATPIAPAFALYVVLLPVTAPLTYYYYRRRKLDKGEW